MSKRNYEVFVGYVVYNPQAWDGKAYICDDAEVYFFLKDARKECRRLTKEFDNPSLEVVKLTRLES